MLKIFLAAAVTLVASLAVWVMPASAHVLQTDGQIGAIFHINPDDNPLSGQPTQYVMSFDDTSGRLNLGNCNCSVAISSGGKTVDSEPLVVSGKTISVNHYTFAKPAVYSLHFSGQPKNGAPGFQPFSLDYIVRVGGGKTKAQPTPLLLYVGLAMLMGLILLGTYATNPGYNYQKKGTK